MTEGAPHLSQRLSDASSACLALLTSLFHASGGLRLFTIPSASPHPSTLPLRNPLQRRPCSRKTLSHAARYLLVQTYTECSTAVVRSPATQQLPALPYIRYQPKRPTLPAAPRAPRRPLRLVALSPPTSHTLRQSPRRLVLSGAHLRPDRPPRSLSPASATRHPSTALL